MDEDMTLKLLEDLMVIAEAVDGTSAEQPFDRFRTAVKKELIFSW